MSLFIALFIVTFFNLPIKLVTQNILVTGKGVPVRNNTQFPFMVAIYNTYKHNYQLACNGVIVAPSYVLTTASCLARVDDERVENRSPEYTISTVSAGSVFLKRGERVEVRAHKWYIHPKYEPFDYKHRCVRNNDVAILEVSEKLPFSKIIDKAELPFYTNTSDDRNYSSSDTTSRIAARDECKLLAFGVTDVAREVYPALGELVSTNVRLESEEQCIRTLKTAKHTFVINGDMCRRKHMCSVSVGGTTPECSSFGSVLLCGGIVTGFGLGMGNCSDPQYPIVYSRVDVNMNWIRAISSAMNFHRCVTAVYICIVVMWLTK